MSGVSRHKVKSAATWKPVCDAHAPKRKEAGLTERQLLGGTDDPRQVVVQFETQDLVPQPTSDDLLAMHSTRLY